MNKKIKQEKMTPAAFQQLVEEELGFVQVAEPLKEKIYQGCQEKQHHWRQSWLRMGKVSLATVLVGVLMVGGAFAMVYWSGLQEYLSEEDWSVVSDSVQNVYGEVRHGDVTMVVEDILPAESQYLLVVSFLNEGKEPWTEEVDLANLTVEIANEIESEYVNFSTGILDKTLSEDGRKLTFLIQGDNWENIEGKEFTVKASNLVKKQDQMIDMTNSPLQRLPQSAIKQVNTQELAVLQSEVVDSNENNQGIAKILYQLISQPADISLAEAAPGFKLAGVVCVEGDTYQPEYNVLKIQPGCYIFTELEDGGDDLRGDYRRGDIWYLKNKQTGEWFYPEFASYGDWAGKIISYCYVPGITAEQLQNYEIAQIFYQQQDLLQEEDWQLSFQVSQEAETLSAPLHLTKVRQWNEKSCDVTYEKATLNYLGLDLWGQAIEQETGDDLGAVAYPFSAAIMLQNGETIPLRERGCSSLESWQTEDIGFVQRYEIDPEQSDLKMIDLKQAAYLLLDGEKIALTKE